MSKLIGTSKLDRVITALYNKLKNMITGEIDRAQTAEEEIQSGVDRLNSMLNGYSIWVGTTEELESLETRDPNTLYFELEENSSSSSDIEVVYNEIVDNVLTLTTDKFQKTEISGTDIEIVFPEVTKFTEIHLYFSATGEVNFSFPECKWRVEPNIELGNSYEIVFIYNTMEWLVNVIKYS